MFIDFLKGDCIYLFLDRGEGREYERERNISHLPLECARTGGLNPQPRHAPWPGIEPVIFCFVGECSTDWATSVRAICWLFLEREGRRKKKKSINVRCERNIDQVPPLNPQPRYVHWPGTEPITFWCTEWSRNWATQPGLCLFAFKFFACGFPGLAPFVEKTILYWIFKDHLTVSVWVFSELSILFRWLFVPSFTSATVLVTVAL